MPSFYDTMVLVIPWYRMTSFRGGQFQLEAGRPLACLVPLISCVLAVQEPGDTWVNLISDHSGTYDYTPDTPGHLYVFRVTGTDSAGNEATAPVAAKPPTLPVGGQGKYQDDSTLVIAGGWAPRPGKGGGRVWWMVAD